jgi:hypothetical protein
MTGKRRRLKLGRLGDQAPESESDESAAKPASMHDEIVIEPRVGRTRTTVNPAPIHEVFRSDEA